MGHFHHIQPRPSLTSISNIPLSQFLITICLYPLLMDSESRQLIETIKKQQDRSWVFWIQKSINAFVRACLVIFGKAIFRIRDVVISTLNVVYVLVLLPLDVLFVIVHTLASYLFNESKTSSKREAKDQSLSDRNQWVNLNLGRRLFWSGADIGVGTRFSCLTVPKTLVTRDTMNIQSDGAAQYVLHAWEPNSGRKEIHSAATVTSDNINNSGKTVSFKGLGADALGAAAAGAPGTASHPETTVSAIRSSLLGLIPSSNSKSVQEKSQSSDEILMPSLLSSSSSANNPPSTNSVPPRHKHLHYGKRFMTRSSGTTETKSTSITDEKSDPTTRPRSHGQSPALSTPRKSLVYFLTRPNDTTELERYSRQICQRPEKE